MAESSKISPYNLADCKNTTDDALQNYLNGLKFQQSHYYTDVKLGLGYAALVICAITFAYDYKLGFEATKYWTAATVVAYFLLDGAFTYWLWFVEKDIIYTGDAKGRKITISSWTRKLDPNYRLKIKSAATAGSKEWQESEVSAPFTNWFTADGVFVPQPFQQWLASSVSFVGEADPKNASAAKGSADVGLSTGVGAGSEKKRKS
ncbi:microsomal signal peptidase 25 kDa subunit-domain-containing protein [Elsinoe ampelina]|uniref:Signal peptidase complex subunit 2 n=1 Tax=Elsinoe ampelina TaxID=302913 RepID=A0A6A6GLI3_9PEZI|nr:microsomal signal peptidase 25 kDa subunit-domain-containing protein [Elsinoe ampelina]